MLGLSLLAMAAHADTTRLDDGQMRNSTLQPVEEPPDIPTPLRDMDKPGSSFMMVGMASLRARDWATAEKWFLKADTAGHPSAGLYLGNVLLLISSEGKDRRPEALAWLLKSAHAGNPEAATTVAKAYYNDKVTAQDFSKSFYWACTAAHLGDPQAMSLLADHYYFGTGASADIDKAIHWAEAAVAKSVQEAETKLTRWKKLRPAKRPAPPPMPSPDKECSS